MSPLKNADTQKLVLSALGLFALAIGFHQFLWHTDSPYIFTRDDNLTYFLPLIKWHTRSGVLFSPAPYELGPRRRLGPFHELASRSFYPHTYLVAHWISELIQMPHALFEISFILHQMIFGGFRPAVGSKKISHRFLLATSLMFAPAPFLLGINWHLYGVAHVWWVIAALWMYRENKTAQPFQTLRSKMVLFVFVALFYSVSHPQMFVWRASCGCCG